MHGPPLHAKLRPHQCSDKSIAPPKLKFLLRFYQNSEYKRPAGAYPWRDFHTICRICTSFQAAVPAKIWMDLLKGLWSYRGFKLRESGFPTFLASPNSKTVHQTPKRFRGARTCLRSSITVQSLVGLGFHSAPGWLKTLSFFVCLFVCPSCC